MNPASVANAKLATEMNPMPAQLRLPIRFSSDEATAIDRSDRRPSPFAVWRSFDAYFWSAPKNKPAVPPINQAWLWPLLVEIDDLVQMLQFGLASSPHMSNSIQ